MFFKVNYKPIYTAHLSVWSSKRVMVNIDVCLARRYRFFKGLFRWFSIDGGQWLDYFITFRYLNRRDLLVKHRAAYNRNLFVLSANYEVALQTFFLLLRQIILNFDILSVISVFILLPVEKCVFYDRLASNVSSLVDAKSYGLNFDWVRMLIVDLLQVFPFFFLRLR